MKASISLNLFCFLLLVFLANNLLAQSITYKLVKYPLDFSGNPLCLRCILKFEITQMDSNDVKIELYKSRDSIGSIYQYQVQTDTVSELIFYNLDIGIYYLIMDFPDESLVKFRGIYFYKISLNNFLRNKGKVIIAG